MEEDVPKIKKVGPVAGAITRPSLKEIVGGWAYRALKEGRAYLYIWRRSSPWNWYIETNRKNTLWHSSSERPRILPDLREFTLVNEDGTVVEPFYPRNRNVFAELSTYKLGQVKSV
jgi:hypothetical protein